MVCSGCATSNDSGRKFCRACGRRLSVACPVCAASNAPDDRFCGECGAPLPAAEIRLTDQGTVRPPSATTERRLVSVLFADLVGSTPFAEGRDPEDVRAMLGGYFDTASEAVHRHGGVVEKFIGDAVMAVWGTPTAHEDDAERAVRSALDIVDRVSAPGRQARGHRCRPGSASSPARRWRPSTPSVRAWWPATWSTPRRASSQPPSRAPFSSANAPTARPARRSPSPRSRH